MMLSSVSRETSERLDVFRELFRKWAKTINLVAPSTLDDMDSRHIADSLQIAALAPETCENWVDIGTGGGFPGLIVAALQAESHPKRLFRLVESDQRKCAFLREAARAMSLKTEVLTSRIELLTPQKADVLSARALAPVARLCEYAERHLAQSGRALFMKGQTYAEEIAAAQKQGWQFDFDIIDSQTRDGSVIMIMQKPSRPG